MTQRNEAIGTHRRSRSGNSADRLSTEISYPLSCICLQKKKKKNREKLRKQIGCVLEFLIKIISLYYYTIYYIILWANMTIRAMILILTKCDCQYNSRKHFRQYVEYFINITILIIYYDL